MNCAANGSAADVNRSQHDNHNFMEKVLECPLCLSLICEPLSISCGHSFCRVCLVKSLRRSKKKCPQCRAVCHISAEDAQENIMIRDLAINWNSTEYASRLIDSEAEKSCWMTLLPIFYYNETLFPGSRLDLHLFEPRYRVMMQRVVNTTRSFAYVPNFNQYRANVGDVALVAVLEEVEFMADGRCMLQAKLSSRMTITEHYVEEGTQGLHFCRLVPLADDPIDPLHLPPVNRLVQLATQIIESVFSTAIRDLESRYGPIPPASGPEAFSLYLAAICPLADREKARLLSSKDTLERLRCSVACLSAVTTRRASIFTTDDAVRAAEESQAAPPVPRRRRAARRQPLRRPRTAQSGDSVGLVADGDAVNAEGMVTEEEEEEEEEDSNEESEEDVEEAEGEGGGEGEGPQRL